MIKDQDREKPWEKASRVLELSAEGSAPGSAIWLPNGMRARRKLMDFSWRLHEALGYEEVKSPNLVAEELFEKSGHLAKYSALMFKMGAKEEEGAEGKNLALRPMSCPNHILALLSKKRSWREMPLRYFEFGDVFRNEASGGLLPFFRQRQFVQDDAHVFAPEGQIGKVVDEFVEMSKKAWKELGIPVIARLSLRPSSRLGSDELWDKAEEALGRALGKAGLAFKEEPGGGAFYGPKLEFVFVDPLGREWQMGVAQLDFALPERFGLSCAGKEKEEPLVMVHHALLGSIERAMGAMLCVHGVNWPWRWHPAPAICVPVSEEEEDLARLGAVLLARALPGAKADRSNAPLGKKIAKAKLMGIPFIFVAGKKEREASSGGDLRLALNGKEVSLAGFLEEIKEEGFSAPR